MTAAAANAGDYRNKPITMIVPLGAGGSHDLDARMITLVLPTYRGQPLVKLMPGIGAHR